VLLATLSLGGCTTVGLTEPGQTATEQLLISTAIDHLVGQLDRVVSAGTKVFVDPQYFDSAPATRRSIRNTPSPASGIDYCARARVWSMIARVPTWSSNCARARSRSTMTIC
jgi:hypothetical protein